MLSNRDQEPFRSVFELLFSKNPHNLADSTPIYISDEETLTYGNLRDLILKCGYNLQKKFNIQKGDVVAIRSFSHMQYPVVLHGTVCTGGSIALVKCSPEDCVDIVAQDLDTVKPKLFIIDQDGCEMSLQAADKANIPRSNILILGNTNMEGLLNVKDVLLSGNNHVIPYICTQDELENMPSYLYFTSGSTGRRKAVTCTTNAILCGLSNAVKTRPDHQRLLANKPFSFVSTVFTELHMCIFVGHRAYYSRAVTADEICHDIEKYKITLFYCAPYVLTQMAKDEAADKYDLSSVKLLCSVGSVLAKSAIQIIKNRFGIKIQNGYGSSETLIPIRGSPELTELGAIGRLNPKYTLRLVDANDNDVKSGVPGELLVKGPMVTKGYYNNPDANEKAFTKDGFYRSGDVLVCDENGIYYFKSRIKNLMKFQSTHIYPYDIEKITVTHPKVADCGVIGIYCEESSTDLPRAYVSLVDEKDYLNQEELTREILNYTNERLHVNKHIRKGLVIMKALPRTETGKIIYGELKEYAAREIIQAN
ncbi:acetyl-CoA synthetase-like protein [Backusella circina FSU 941]|nr:acetyl-CoA synthetase-like protein [Backusella circina FSU 941]